MSSLLLLRGHRLHLLLRLLLQLVINILLALRAPLTCGKWAMRGGISLPWQSITRNIDN